MNAVLLNLRNNFIEGWKKKMSVLWLKCNEIHGEPDESIGKVIGLFDNGFVGMCESKNGGLIVYGMEEDRFDSHNKLIAWMPIPSPPENIVGLNNQ